jgi:hypothetical protein
MAIRLRNSIAVGFINGSLNEMTGNSSGRPPACMTPRFTAWAKVRKCALQLVNSDQELQIPMIGRPVIASVVKPSDFKYAR